MSAKYSKHNLQIKWSWVQSHVIIVSFTLVETFKLLWPEMDPLDMQC